MDDSFSEVRNLVIRNFKGNKNNHNTNSELFGRFSRKEITNTEFKVEAENLELKVITRNIRASTTPREDFSILKKVGHV